MIELKGAPVAKKLQQDLQIQAQALAEYGITPKLAIVRVGENPDDLWYERAAIKCLTACGAEVATFVLTEGVTQQELLELIAQLNANPTIHGILLLRPLPPHINERAIADAIATKKDVDGASKESLAGLLDPATLTFAPCTAEAVMHLLDAYGFEFTGANAVVCGRSLVVGKALLLMLLARNATPTCTHSKTLDLLGITQSADLVICAMGRGERLDKRAFKKGAWAVDVATRQGEDGQIEGDIVSDSAAKRLAALSPVPGGVGPLTTAILAQHVIRAAQSTLS